MENTNDETKIEHNERLFYRFRVHRHTLWMAFDRNVSFEIIQRIVKWMRGMKKTDRKGEKERKKWREIEWKKRARVEVSVREIVMKENGGWVWGKENLHIISKCILANVNIIFMPKIKWNANILLYNDEVFELVWWTELDGQHGMVEKSIGFDGWLFGCYYFILVRHSMEMHDKNNLLHFLFKRNNNMEWV